MYAISTNSRDIKTISSDKPCATISEEQASVIKGLVHKTAKCANKDYMLLYRELRQKFGHYNYKMMCLKNYDSAVQYLKSKSVCE